MRQLLVCMKGHPGSGKSVLANTISRELHIPLLDKDDARDCFQPVVEQGPDINWNELSYQVLKQFVRHQLANGLSAVVDTPLARVSLYQSFRDLAEEFGAQLIVVECVCSNSAEWRDRVQARGAASSQTNQAHKPADWQQLQDLLTGYQGCWRWTVDGSTRVEHLLRVDTATTHQGAPGVGDRVVAKLRTYLQGEAGTTTGPQMHVFSNLVHPDQLQAAV